MLATMQAVPLHLTCLGMRGECAANDVPSASQLMANACCTNEQSNKLPQAVVMASKLIDPTSPHTREWKNGEIHIEFVNCCVPGTYLLLLADLPHPIGGHR